MTIKVGDEPRAVTFTVAPDGATNKTLNVTSEDDAIFTWTDGKVVPVSNGAAKLIAEATDGSGVKAEVAVTVNPAE
ncbi:hypothetical protein EC99P2_00012 [Enterococcus phage EC99P2]|nr:hypothetical protein EC99P2_00012 [Enterococcus phage EC99P2]